MNVKTVFAAILLVVVVSLALSGSTAGPTGSLTYTINGLTCPLSSGRVLYHVGNDSRTVSAIEQVIQSPKFLSGTKGLPYGFYYASIDAVGPTYFNGTTTPAYTTLELGFATYGANTPCIETGRFLNWLDVQVPLLDGTYDIAAESVHSLGPPK